MAYLLSINNNSKLVRKNKIRWFYSSLSYKKWLNESHSQVKSCNKNKSCFVLIRGLLREQRHWDEFTQSLTQQFPDTEILTLDILGNGGLYQQTSPNTIEGLTEALRSQLAGKKY